MGARRAKASTSDGLVVRLESCRHGQAPLRAEDAVDELREQGWTPSDIAVLETGPRRSEQTNRCHLLPVGNFRRSRGVRAAVERRNHSA